MDQDDNDFAPPESVEVPLDGTLDLHTFAPREIASVVEEYVWACLEQGIHAVRIIHGKGTGAQRRTVWAVLQKHPAVRSHRAADERAGGWGATLAELDPAATRE